MLVKYLKSLVEPGEAVGLLAGQVIFFANERQVDFSCTSAFKFITLNFISQAKNMLTPFASFSIWLSIGFAGAF